MRLRTVRERYRVGVRQLARELHIAPGFLSNWEAGCRAPAEPDVTRILGILRVSEVDFAQVMEDFRHLDSDVHTELITADRTPLLWAYEKVSRKIVEWAPRLPPDLFRTPDFARRTLGSHFLDPDEVDRQVFLQQAREDILTSEDGPEYTLFIGADALLPQGLSVDVAVDQVRNLLKLSQERRVIVRLVAADQQQLGAVDGFAFFHPDRARGATVVLKSWPCNVYFSSPSQLLRYRRIVRDLDGIALNATESFAAMRQTLSRLDTRVRDLAS
ncbi:Scr1 family TA system antitoxin-like transcriptional regulator [Amycolatopsis sp. NBC_01480]|uniref:Scr1 family TA system antitoxin-like transcriptional regulator n=1 Tax=Amycolatopsis sp. NBC_01480 TaxID=2903562 RepID=UPI003FA46E40